jgi:F-type H+-transporting ATPase subunit b
MTRHPSLRLVLLAAFIALLTGAAWSQQHSSSSTQTDKQQPKTTQKKAHSGEGASASQAQEGPEGELEEASREAAGEDPTAEFKLSGAVRWLARVTGLTPFTAYWIFVGLNFVIIVVLLVVLLKSKVPASFRARTATIQQGIAEARKTSEEAMRRLREIEGRLAKIDSEVAAMAAAAEVEAQKEGARIHAAAEEDKRKIVESAEQEIAAAARLARTELRAYVSELAVALAEKRIQVNASTDQELVRLFVDELGKNGK